MDKYSTINITMNVLTCAFELGFIASNKLDLSDSDQAFNLFEEMIPYDLEPIGEDGTGPFSSDHLPPGFIERRYYILSSGKVRAVVEAVVRERSLINFNLLVFPKEWRKARAIESTFQNGITPYVLGVSSGKWVVNKNPPCLINHDRDRGLIFQFRCETKRQPYLGLSIVDDRYA